jgi:hypothetical protein
MMVAGAVGNVPYLLFSSALKGLGAAMVWIHQGVCLEAVARKRSASAVVCRNEHEGSEEADKRLKKDIGSVAGIFWPVCSISGIL